MSARSAVEDATRYLRVALLSCAPQVRDAVAAGNVGAPFVQATFDMVDNARDISGRSADLRVMQAAASRLAEIEVGIGEPLTFTVLASYVEVPRVEAIRVRSNSDFVGARVVTILCPFAEDHVYRGRGHEFHMHGWPAGFEADETGSIGTRVPHCDGAVRRADPLPRIEIVIPPHLRTTAKMPRP